MPIQRRTTSSLPPRLAMPSPFTWGVVLVFLALFIQGVMATNLTLERSLRGGVNLVHFIGRAFPPT